MALCKVEAFRSHLRLFSHLFLSSLIPLCFVHAAEESLVYEGEYIVKLKQGEQGQDHVSIFGGLAASVAQQGEYRLIRINPGLQGNTTVGQVTTYNAQVADEMCSELSQQAALEHCEPNVRWGINMLPSDELYDQLYGMNQISAPLAWETSTGSDEVIVAITDTGVDYNHPDLAANMWRNPGEIAGNGIDDDKNGHIDDVFGIDTFNKDGDPIDDHGHGTHCAGTVGAIGNNNLGVVGVNWNVRIMALKFLGPGGGGSTFDAISLIQYAVAHGAKVINASWGGTFYSKALEDAIRESEQAGVVFVAASGNSAKNNDLKAHYPSSYALSNVVAVAATDEHDNLASFSNYGFAGVDVAAPGFRILSTFPGGQYTYLSGTSMAAPHVAGLAGLIYSVHTAEPHTEIIRRLKNGDKLATLTGLIASGARINAMKALSEEPPVDDGSSAPSGSVVPTLFSSKTHPKKAVLYKNKRFVASFEGEAGEQFVATLSLTGLTNETCTLGTFNLDDRGKLSIGGKLKLTGLARYFTSEATISVPASPTVLVRRVRRLKRGTKVSQRRARAKARHRKRYASALSESCSKIKASVAVAGRK